MRDCLTCLDPALAPQLTADSAISVLISAYTCLCRGIDIRMRACMLLTLHGLPGAFGH